MTACTSPTRGSLRQPSHKEDSKTLARTLTTRSLVLAKADRFAADGAGEASADSCTAGSLSTSIEPEPLLGKAILHPRAPKATIRNTCWFGACTQSTSHDACLPRLPLYMHSCSNQKSPRHLREYHDRGGALGGKLHGPFRSVQWLQMEKGMAWMSARLRSRILMAPQTEYHQHRVVPRDRETVRYSFQSMKGMTERFEINPLGLAGSCDIPRDILDTPYRAYVCSVLFLEPSSQLGTSSIGFKDILSAMKATKGNRLDSPEQGILAQLVSPVGTRGVYDLQSCEPHSTMGMQVCSPLSLQPPRTELLNDFIIHNVKVQLTRWGDAVLGCDLTMWMARALTRLMERNASVGPDRGAPYAATSITIAHKCRYGSSESHGCGPQSHWNIQSINSIPTSSTIRLQQRRFHCLLPRASATVSPSQSHLDVVRKICDDCGLRCGVGAVFNNTLVKMQGGRSLKRENVASLSGSLSPTNFGNLEV